MNSDKSPTELPLHPEYPKYSYWYNNNHKFNREDRIECRSALDALGRLGMLDGGLFKKLL